MESKPLRMSTPDYSMEREEEHVRRLHALLASYYADMQEAARTPAHRRGTGGGAPRRNWTRSACPASPSASTRYASTAPRAAPP